MIALYSDGWAPGRSKFSSFEAFYIHQFNLARKSQKDLGNIFTVASTNTSKWNHIAKAVLASCRELQTGIMSFILPFHTFHTFYTFIHSISTESTVLSSILIFLLMVMSLDFHATIREPRNGLLVLLLVTIFAILAWYSLFPQPVCQFSFVLLFIFFHLSAHLV